MIKLQVKLPSASWVVGDHKNKLKYENLSLIVGDDGEISFSFIHKSTNTTVDYRWADFKVSVDWSLND